jgi:hypothetical protein
VYTTSECRGFLERAGFVNAIEKEWNVDEEVHAFIVAIKP